MNWKGENKAVNCSWFPNIHPWERRDSYSHSLWNERNFKLQDKIQEKSKAVGQSSRHQIWPAARGVSNESKKFWQEVWGNFGRRDRRSETEVIVLEGLRELLQKMAQSKLGQLEHQPRGRSGSRKHSEKQRLATITSQIRQQLSRVCVLSQHRLLLDWRGWEEEQEWQPGGGHRSGWRRGGWRGRSRHS